MLVQQDGCTDRGRQEVDERGAPTPAFATGPGEPGQSLDDHHRGQGDGDGAEREDHHDGREDGWILPFVGALASGRFVRIEGCAWPTPQVGNNGLGALTLYWREGRGDNFLTTCDEDEAAAIGAGYQFARLEAFARRGGAGASRRRAWCQLPEL